jgi:hypothetical protein
MQWQQLRCCLNKRAILLFFLVSLGGGGWLFLPQRNAELPFPVVPALCVENLAAQGGGTVCPAYQPGEKLQYRVSWEKILAAGTAEISVKNDNNLYEFALRAQSSAALDAICSLTDEMISRYDPVNGFPIQYLKKFTLKKKTVSEATQFNQLGHSAHWQAPNQPARDLNIELGTQDPISALYSIRNLGLRPGMMLYLPLSDGGRKYLLAVRVTGTELVSVSLGSFKTLRVELSLSTNGQTVPNKKFVIWLTDDSRKIPVLASVQLPFGSGLVELTSYS